MGTEIAMILFLVWEKFATREENPSFMEGREEQDCYLVVMGALEVVERVQTYQGEVVDIRGEELSLAMLI